MDTTHVAWLTERCADGASSVHERANWPAEYKPKYCFATVAAATAVSGWMKALGRCVFR